MKKEELKKELEKLKDFKVYAFEGDVYVKAEDYKEIAIENKNLKSDLEQLREAYKKYYDRDKEELMESCYSLAKENEFLKRELKDVEQVSERDYNLMKNNNDMLREEKEQLEEENKKLKSDLEECECSMHFENDEVGFWKREYKRLKKWIKDHCKGCGNLFPEDEMKRQWKKADKKRK